jgi:hypothetical protein
MIYAYSFFDLPYFQILLEMIFSMICIKVIVPFVNVCNRHLVAKSLVFTWTALRQLVIEVDCDWRSGLFANDMLANKVDISISDSWISTKMKTLE